MSSTRHSALLRWSPLHPPLTRSTPVPPQDPAPSDETERGDDAALLDLREGGERLAVLREG